MLQHVNITINFIDNYVKSFHFLLTILYISTQLCKHNYKIISQGNGKFVAYTPCLKYHVHYKPTGLRRVYVGIGSLFCIIDLLIAPVANVLMRLGCPVDKALSLPVLLLCKFIRNCKILRRTVQLQPHQFDFPLKMQVENDLLKRLHIH